MASKYASTHKNIKALALYASYPSGDELKDSNIEVVSIYGSKDGVVNKENLDESKENLPDGSEFIEIKGGNHSQFGDYGLQNGDNKATISGEKQFNYTAKYTTELLDKIKESQPINKDEVDFFIKQKAQAQLNILKLGGKINE